MDVLDVNVLLNAHRAGQPEHEQTRRWFDDLINGAATFAIPGLVLSGFLRVTTNPRAFPDPTPIDVALQAASAWRERSNCVPIEPGPRHWGIFVDLCSRTGARGNAVPDTYLAALTIESGGVFVSADRGFARFPGLRWRHPLDG